MNRKILVSIFALVIFINCNNKKEVKLKSSDLDGVNLQTENLKVSLKKVVVVDLKEICLTYFKVEVENPNDKTVVLIDNNLSEIRQKGFKAEENGFYLKGKANDSLIMLGISNNYFYSIGPKKKGYLFIAARNLKGSEKKKDSLLFKSNLAKFNLEYNGKKLDLDKIPKSKYISTKVYNDFLKSKRYSIPYKGIISEQIPEKNLPLKYLSELPITTEEWNNL